MSFFLHDILGLGDGDERKAASRRRGSAPNAREAPRTKAATTASSAVGRAVPRDVRTTPRTAPTPPSPRRDHAMGLPPPPPPIAVKKTPPTSPARPPVRPSPGQELVDAIRDALVRRRRSNNDTSSAHRRIEPETRDDRPKDFPPSHTPGGTSARRVFTGVRDLLEDLRAAVDDAELMEQQRGGPDATFSSLDLELDAGTRAQAANTCALVWSALDAFHDPYQHEDQFLAHGGVDVLLCVMRTFPLDANVVAAAAGACLSLARDCPAGRRVLERCGGRRALRAAMCAHPGVNFGGAFGG